MTDSIVVRHGESTWNAAGLRQGWADPPLTTTGIKQASTTGNTLAEDHIIDHIYTSGLIRAHQTAHIIHNALPENPPITTDNRLREQNFGIASGIPKADFEEKFPEYDVDESGRGALERSYPLGEAYVDLRERTLAAWEEIQRRHADTETVLIVTHGMPVRAIRGHLDDMELVSEYCQHVDNCELTVASETVETRQPAADVATA